ncbi:hypothetical protein [Nocardia arizonensis]|uniref:hypothetical protein n=1 Tax=Nocardia arizonensis TaxID=1141647 RepID=UPI0012E1FDE1|nr:hypothetical protein [Nocardia arizonensis]
MSKSARRAAAGILLLAVAGCGHGGGDEVVVAGPPGPAPISAATIVIEHNAYSGLPPITPGAAITVVNRDLIRHSVTSKRPGLFDHEVEPGHSIHFNAPTEIGSFEYYCHYHALMDGWLSIRA